ncbi:MAG: DUF1800 domain-containing protein [Reichenbachiella sp.]
MSESFNPSWDTRDREEIERFISEQSGGVKHFELEDYGQISSINQKQRILTTTGLAAYSGDLDDHAITHLLKRTLFGVKQSELDAFKQLSLADAVSQLISESELPTIPVNDYGPPENPDPDVAFGAEWVDAPTSNTHEGDRILSLKGWTINNIINQDSNIHEKMILFWHNLLPTQAYGVFVSKTSYRYFEMLRRNALGNFKTLIKELTLDSCMLLYLNGAFNNKYAPDENYSRELQELFTIGKGPNSGYTESDVQEGARLLTGFRLDWDHRLNEGPWEHYFEPDWHDTGDKQFSEFYGNRVIEGKTGAEGADELDEMLDMIFENNETALYICRRIYNFFVYSEIDDSVEKNVIEPLAQIFRDNDFEIAPVLKTLFSSEHFFDSANRGAMIKNPMDHFLGFWRTLDIQHLDEEDSYLKFITMRSVYWGYLNSTGMRIGDPPSVSGWPAYYQVPSFDKSWITTDTVTRRAGSIDGLIFGWFWINEDHRLSADLIRFIESLPNPGNPNVLIEDITKLFYGSIPTQESLDYLKNVLLSGQSTDGYWTSAWIDYSNDPGNETFQNTINSRLRSCFQAICQLGEFQLM